MVDRTGRTRPGTRKARARAVPMPTGTASTTAMAVVSSEPRMNGSSPYWPCVGFQTFPTSHENPRVEKAGFACTMTATRNQAARAATSTATTASRPL